MELTQEDMKNLIILINKATISGAESVVVATLLQKLAKLIEPPKEK